jgi:uncharacterized protein (TIGR01244 family)
VSLKNIHESRISFTIATLLFALSSSAFADESDWKYRFEPVEGITAAGQPNEEGLRELAESGYAAVIDLRTEGENRGMDEKALVESLGLEYISLPIAGKAAISYDNAGKLDQILDRYDEPVLVHCGSGNRVGALFALRAKMKGASDEDALEAGRSAGMTSLEETVRSRLAE